MTAPTDLERPTDRALHALGRPLTGCSAYAGGKHRDTCPGAHGHDDNLDDLPTQRTGATS